MRHLFLCSVKATICQPENTRRTLLENRTNVAVTRRVSAGELEQMAPSDDVLSTATVFSQAFNTFAKALEKAVQPAGLTVSQFITLWALLFSAEPMTPTEISRLLPIETHSVSALLDRLQKRKLIRRRRSTSDRRTVKVTLTAQGEQLVKDIAPAMRLMMLDVFQTLSSRELRMLNRLARKIRNASVQWLGANPDHIEITVERIAGAVQTLRLLNNGAWASAPEQALESKPSSTASEEL